MTIIGNSFDAIYFIKIIVCVDNFLLINFIPVSPMTAPTPIFNIIGLEICTIGAADREHMRLKTGESLPPACFFQNESGSNNTHQAGEYLFLK